MTDLLTIQIKGALENTIFNKINSQQLNVSNSVLRAIISRVAEEAASGIVQSVNIGANTQLNTIPTSLIGNYNPVNIVTQNLSSFRLTNNLQNILDTQITGQATDKIVSLLDRELRNALPADKYGLINFSAISATLVQLITPSVSSAVSTALKEFTGGLFSGNNPVQPVIPSVDSVFGKFGTNSDQALSEINSTYSFNGASRQLQQNQSYTSQSSDNREKLITTSKGFIDPSANYPTKEYENKPDTNKLATGDLSGGSIIRDKNLNRMMGAKLPYGNSWDEPKSAYNAVYPFNKVTQTESGHIIEIDDTPGNERLHIFHKSGTYVEIDSTGSVVSRTKGSKYEIIDKNGKIAILGKADISISGACNIYVGNDANIEVDGDTNITCHNDTTIQSAGNVNIAAGETLNLAGKDVNIQAFNVLNITSNIELNAHSTNALNINSNVEMTIETVTSFTRTLGDSFSSVQGTQHVITGGDYNLDSGGMTHINSGNAQGTDKVSKVAGASGISMTSERRLPNEEVIADPISLTLADRYILDNEETIQEPEEQRAHRDRLILSGIVSPEELDREPVVQDTASVASSQTIVVSAEVYLKDVTYLPGNYNLSPNFTLESLTTQAAVSNDDIETSEFSYGEIVYNLQLVALNILEPIYNLYPNMFVISGFRKRENTSGASLHPKGCAVDIQFRDTTRDEYFEISKLLAKALKYDQLILEYSSYASQPWIHISFVDGENRGEVLTMWNHRVHSQELALLA